MIFSLNPWTYFANCEKLEIYFPAINETEEKYAQQIVHHSALKLVKHPNLHVVLGRPVRVSDANPTEAHRKPKKWFAESFWTLVDVENFVNRIAFLSIKTLTYTISNLNLPTFKPQQITFDCDEKFPISFLEYLETQPIFCGYEEGIKDKEGFLTLELAKATFPT